MKTLSAGHAASLATTAGITGVITGVIAASLLGQYAGLTGGAAHLTAIALLFLSLGIGLLYGAREALGQTLDLMPLDPQLARMNALRGLVRYHLGMGGLFLGLAFAASGRLAQDGWGVVMVLGGLAMAAGMRSYRCFQELQRSH